MLGKLGIPALEVEPQLHESQSKGAVETGVQIFKGMLGVHFLRLEPKIGHHIPSKHPLVTWLVEYVSDIITKYHRGSDGRTAYERFVLNKSTKKALSLENACFGKRAQART